MGEGPNPLGIHEGGDSRQAAHCFGVIERTALQPQECDVIHGGVQVDGQRAVVEPVGVQVAGLQHVEGTAGQVWFAVPVQVGQAL